VAKCFDWPMVKAPPKKRKNVQISGGRGRGGGGRSYFGASSSGKGGGAWAPGRDAKHARILANRPRPLPPPKTKTKKQQIVQMPMSASVSCAAPCLLPAPLKPRRGARRGAAQCLAAPLNEATARPAAVRSGPRSNQVGTLRAAAWYDASQTRVLKAPTTAQASARGTQQQI
jgi:hypothetical protein